MEALFGEGQENIVLAGKVAVDRSWAVFDFLGNLADGDVLISLGDEEIPRGVQYGAGGCDALPFVPFPDPHAALPNLVHLNSV